MSVPDRVACGVIDRNLRQDVRARLERLKLGLEDRLDDRVGLLSGGQRQAISLLMATTGRTRVLLLDEHTAALDPATAEFVLKLTDEIVRDLSISVVMVTHSMAQALHHGDRTIMFHRGRIVFDVSGTSAEEWWSPSWSHCLNGTVGKSYQMTHCFLHRL